MPRTLTAPMLTVKQQDSECFWLGGKRAEWAESVLTETLPLKEQYLELLARSGIHSLFDAVRRTPDMLAIDIDIPTYQSDTQLNEWVKSQQEGYLTHTQALEIIKQQIPKTAQVINEYQAQGVELAADGFHKSVFSAIEEDGVIKSLLYIKADLMQFAASLRGEHNG